MSRGQKLLELALRAAQIDPAHQTLTFIVNHDGSLSLDENQSDPSTQSSAEIPVQPVQEIVQNFQGFIVQENLPKEDIDLNLSDNQIEISETTLDTINDSGLKTSHLVDDHDQGNMPEEDISPREDDLTLPENLNQISDETPVQPVQEDVHIFQGFIVQENLPEEDVDFTAYEKIIDKCDTTLDTLNDSGSTTNSGDIPDQGRVPEVDINPCENYINLSENVIDIPEQEDSPIRKRKKRHQVKIATWKVNQWKEARKKGKEYCGKRKNDAGQYEYEVKKDSRKMKTRCKCKRKENSLLQCASLTENKRQRNFDEFWKLEWEGKRLFVKLLTQKSATARARGRKDEEKSRRKYSCNYFLKQCGTNVRVCKTMFLNTLSIGEWMALNWQAEEDAEENDSVQNDEEINEEVIEPPRKKLRKSAQVESLEEFFRSLPKVESHYCRKRTQKLYLEPNWTSKRELFLFYQNDWCVQKNLEPLSSCKFHQLFEDQNLALFKPKKDACDKCESYRTGNLNEQDYESHILRKDEARIEKEADGKKEDCLTFTMDLQSLLLSPKSNVSALYYKMKLATHNFTVYNLGTHEGFCFLWNETEGGLTSNEFATIIYKFLQSQLPLPEGMSRLVVYSDGCAYQNRSANVANALLHFSCKNQVTVEQKYLEVGHTQMEGDSMHSLIERKLKNVKINVPADYVDVCRKARKSPAEYKVEYLEHTYFKNFEAHLFFKSIRPGKAVGDPCVTDIRALQYNPDGTIKYKFNFSEEWQLLPQRKNTTVRAMAIENLPNLYKQRLTIKKRKYNDLQDLKSILPRDYHEFYDNIPCE